MSKEELINRCQLAISFVREANIKEAIAEINIVTTQINDKDLVDSFNKVFSKYSRNEKNLYFGRIVRAQYDAETTNIDSTLLFIINNALDRIKSINENSQFNFNGNIFGYPDNLIGFQEEMETIKGYFQMGTRLVVLHGNGGVGKTRLAIQIAKDLNNDFKDGTWLIELDRIEKAEQVPWIISKAFYVKETNNNLVQEQLFQYLNAKQMLLILDNLEHISGATDFISKMVRSAPHIKIIVTSRKKIRDLDFLQDGKNYPITSLKFPNPIPKNKPMPPAKWHKDTLDIEALSQFDAVILFIETAQKFDHDFNLTVINAAIIAEICYRLEGLALAIELAAASIDKFDSPAELLDNLSSVFNLEAVIGNGRQKTMNATIEWSYQLLSDREKKLFRFISSFKAGFTKPSAFVVCALPGFTRADLESDLQSLVDTNLLIKYNLTTNVSRYRMHNLIREFASNKLREQGEYDILMKRFAEFFLNVAEKFEKLITSPDRSETLQVLEDDHANFRSALEWSLMYRGKEKFALRLAGSLFWFWNLQSHFSEGLLFVNNALKLNKLRTAERAKALYCAGGLSFLKGEMETGLKYLNESESIWRTLNNNLEYKRGLGFTLIILSQINTDENCPNKAIDQIKESEAIFSELEDRWGLALAYNDHGNVLRSQGKYPDALECYYNALKLWEEWSDKWGLPLTLSNIGFVASLMGDYSESFRHLNKAMKIQREVEDKWGLAETLKCLGDVEIHLDNYSEAERKYCESLKLNYIAGRKQLAVACLQGLAIAADAINETEKATLFFKTTEYLRNEIGLFTNLIDNSLEMRFELTKKKYLDIENRMFKEGSAKTFEEIIDYALTFCK